jgi:HlyD family secretion protein
MQPGTPVVTLADLDHVCAATSTRPTWGGCVSQDAIVTARSYPGKVSRYVSLSPPTPVRAQSVENKERVTLVYRTKVDVENPRHELKPGMPADALIDLSHGGPQQDGYRGPQGKAPVRPPRGAHAG